MLKGEPKKGINFYNMTDRGIVNYIFEHASNENIVKFCGLTEEEYINGIEDNDTFLFEQALDTVKQMPADDLYGFLCSLQK